MKDTPYSGNSGKPIQHFFRYFILNNKLYVTNSYFKIWHIYISELLRERMKNEHYTRLKSIGHFWLILLSPKLSNTTSEHDYVHWELTISSSNVIIRALHFVVWYLPHFQYILFSLCCVFIKEIAIANQFPLSLFWFYTFERHDG